jgi:serine/threonine protein kinase
MVALIGAGVMGEAYLAKDAKLNREVAIKVFPTRLRGIERSVTGSR